MNIPANTLRVRTTVPVMVRALLTSACALLPSGCRQERPPATAEPAAAWFEERAEEAGIAFRYQSGHRGRHWFPEIMGGGTGICDFDGDGFMDLYFVQGHPLGPGSNAEARPANRMFRNRGDGTFTDVTVTSRTGDTGYGMGCACGDYDGDGHTDLYVTNVGANVMYRNNGDGTFADVTAASGTGDAGWGSSAAFVDYDADGDLDLYVVNYINWSVARELTCSSLGGQPDYCKPANYNAPARDTLYRNNGDGAFTDVSVAAGLDQAFGTGLGIACGDYDNDGRMDFYVANDGMKNQLWINAGDGRFNDRALPSGCAVNIHGVAEAGMGVAGVDLEPDGDLDLFLSHLRNETNTLYLNNGGVFEDRTAMVGLAAPSLNFTGFGLGFADFDHDGALDLYVANGRVMLHLPQLDATDPYAEPNQLFAGGGDGRFTEVQPRGGTSRPLVHTSRAAAIGDLDNDGDFDVVVVNKDAPAYLLSNVARNRGSWVMFRLLNRGGSDALGAVVAIDSGGVIRRRTLQPAYGYCSSSDPRIHCGLPAGGQVDSVTVIWTDGEKEKFGPFQAGLVHVIRQGK